MANKLSNVASKALNYSKLIGAVCIAVSGALHVLGYNDLANIVQMGGACVLAESKSYE